MTANWQAQSYKAQLPAETMVHPGLANCMSKILKKYYTSLRFSSGLMFPVQDEVTKLMNSFKNLNLNCEQQAEIPSFHALTRANGSIGQIVLCMQGKKSTILYFRTIWIPVSLKSKRYYSLLKKSRKIIICHLLDAYPNQVRSWAYTPKEDQDPLSLEGRRLSTIQYDTELFTTVSQVNN